MPDGRRTQRLRALARILRGERAVAAAVRAALDVLLDAAARALASAGYDPAVLDSRSPAWRAAIAAGVDPAIAGVFTEAFRAAARGVIDPDPYAARHLATVQNRLVGVSDEVFSVMRATLQEGRAAGEGIADLAARVDALLTDDQRWANRATVIARTEVVGANNAGATASARASAENLGVREDDVVKEWLATSDSRTRRTHKDADGQQVRGVDALFNVGRATLLHPGDPRGRAEEVINCRCTPVFFYPGDPDYPADLAIGAAPATATPPDLSRVTVENPAATLVEAADGETIVPRKDGGVLSRVSRRLTAAAVDQEDPVTAPTDTAPEDGPEEHTTVCIVAVPAAGDPVHDIGPEEKHATLLFLGEAATLPEGARALLEQVISVTAGQYAATEVPVTGVEPLGDDDPPAQVWMLEPGSLDAVRDTLLDVDSEVIGLLENAEQFPTFTPHVTIGYGSPEVGTDEATDLGLVSDDNLDEARQVESITFDRLALWWTGERVEVPLAAAPSEPPLDEPADTETAAVEEPGDPVPDGHTPDAPAEAPTHAGVAVQATDTGRVLMIQRWWDEEDPPEVRGTWEFPGGGLEDNETPEEGAWREFGEETGLPAPPGEVTGGWSSPDGVYQAFVFTTPVEADAFPEGLNPAPAGRVDTDPDNPDADTRPDAQAWWTLEQIQDLGAGLRPEVREHTDWSQFMPTPAPAEPTGDAVAAALDALRTAGYAVTVSGAQTATLRVAAPDDAAPTTEAIPPQPVGATGPAPEDIPAEGRPFYGIALAEGATTGDGRLMVEGSGTWRDLPLPFMVQDATAPGHDGAVRVGRIDTMVRDDTTYARPVIRYTGVYDDSDAARETERQVENKVLRGVSIDYESVVSELRGSDGTVLDPMVDDFPADGVVIETATAYRIAGLTGCSIPAFHQAYIANGRLEDRTDPEPGVAELADGSAVNPDLPAPEPTEDGLAASAWSLVASGQSFTAPADAFLRPACLDEHAAGTPLTVTADGRVYGHLATWGTCHIGVAGRCQEPPASASNYAHFATGSVLTDDGALVPVGPLTMGTGHAAMNLGARAAAEHYDNTGTVVADITMGQDHIGIWYAGIVRPGTTEAQVYALRAAGKVSGDWRTLGGSLDLVAALVVNTPGFPIPRPAFGLAASAAPVPQESMVAAGMVQTASRETRGDTTAAADTAVVTAVLAALDRRARAATAQQRLAAHRGAHRRARAATAAARIHDRSTR